MSKFTHPKDAKPRHKWQMRGGTPMTTVRMWAVKGPFGIEVATRDKSQARTESLKLEAYSLLRHKIVRVEVKEVEDD